MVKNDKYTIYNDDIKSSLYVLRRDFILVVAILGIFVAVGESRFMPRGVLTNNPTACYALAVTGVILALGSVYFGLKFFAKFTKDKDYMTSHFNHPLICYRSMCLIRVVIIAGAAAFNILAYYLTKSNSCLLMAFVPAIALFFCWPTRGKLENYIHFITDGECEVAQDDDDDQDDVDTDDYQ